MRIALIARGCRPGSGIERYTFELANRLSEKHQVDILTNPREYEHSQARLVEIDVQEKPLWYSVLRFSRMAGERARSGNYDIVHTQGSDADWGDVVTAHSCHSAGMRASLKVDSSPENQLRKILSPAHRNVLSMERQALTSAKKIVSVSRAVARQIQAAYPKIRQTPVHVIYPGVDVAQFDNSTMFNLRKKVRADLGITEERVVCALVANDPKLKGASRVIDALAKLKNTSIMLLVASSKGEQRDLERHAQLQQVGQQVKFITTTGDARPAYAACDIYMGMPEYESFGLTYLEAMAAGKPVLLTRNAGMAELITHEQEGVLLPALASTDVLAEALTHLVCDESFRNNLAEKARQTAEHHTWNTMVEKLEIVYEQVLEMKKGKKSD